MSFISIFHLLASSTIFLYYNTFCSEINLSVFKTEVLTFWGTNKDNNFLGYGILVQGYINFDKEFRVNVVNGKGIGCVVKNSNKVTKNAYQGAKFYKTNNEEVIKIAEQVSKTHKLFFAGVDIIEKNGKYYVLECNRNPAFKEFDKALNIKTADYFIKNVYYESIKFNKNK